MYKDHLFAARCRRESLLREQESRPVPRRLLGLLGARRARVLSGTTGVIGFLLLVASAVTERGYSTQVLCGTWLSMGLVYLAARRWSRWHDRNALRAITGRTRRIFEDLALLDSGGAVGLVRHEVQRLEKRSLVLPVVALSLLGPLSLHYLIGASLLDVGPDGFNHWVLLSLILVGHAHITLLILSVAHVSRVRREIEAGISPCGVARGLWALLWTVTASAIPGAVFLFVPPVLVALTGLIFVPWMFLWVTHRATRERLLLDDLDG